MSMMREKVERVEAMKQKLRLGGGPEEVEKLHAKGKLSCRERIDRLLDPGSFQEIEMFTGAIRTGFEIDSKSIPGDAMVGGYGEVNGRPIYVWAQDATVLDGTMGQMQIGKIVRLMEKALRERVPIVGIHDSPGFRVENAVVAYNFCNFGTMMRFQTLSSGVIPQIALVMGPCVGGAALSAALCDFVFMVRNTSYMHVAPPPPGVAGEEYGSAQMHARVSGGCDVLAQNDEDCIKKCRELLAFLPQNNTEKPPIVATGDDPERISEELLDIVPAEDYKWFDMHDVIERIVDNGYYFELKRDYAPNLITCFARFDGQPVGIIANNPIWRGGCEDTLSADKHARFTRFCDAFNIPLVYLADCPAFYPSVEEERMGILRHGSAVIHATGEATVPKISIYMRKVIGGANLVMPSQVMKADRVIGWPSLTRAVVGAAGTVAITQKGELERAKTPEEAEAIRQKALESAKAAMDRAAVMGTDDTIDPRRTRPVIIRALKCLANKKMERPARKHDNMNL